MTYPVVESGFACARGQAARVALGALWATFGVLAFGACGGSSQQAAPTQRSVKDFAKPQEETPPPEPMRVRGALGTIPQKDVDATLQKSMDKFLDCTRDAEGDAADVAGSLKLFFRVAESGLVEWVYPQQSQLAEWAVERCVLAEAGVIRFPKPRGGPAEVIWTLRFGEHEPQASALNADEVARLLESNAKRALDFAGCPRSTSGGPVGVVMRVDAQGRVLGVGAAVNNHQYLDTAECFISSMKSWQIPRELRRGDRLQFDVW